MTNSVIWALIKFNQRETEKQRSYYGNIINYSEYGGFICGVFALLNLDSNYNKLYKSYLTLKLGVLYMEVGLVVIANLISKSTLIKSSLKTGKVCYLFLFDSLTFFTEQS